MTSSSPSMRIKMAMSTLIASIFFALVVIFIRTYAQNVPMNDQVFYSVPVAVQAAQGDFSLSEMLIKHKGSRLFWTNLITYAVAASTQWNLILESWVSLILAILIFVVLIKLASFDLADVLPNIVISFAALVFSINQQFNWIWALHNSTFFFVFFFLLAVLVIRKNEIGWYALFVAALLCFCSLISLQQGIVSWPAIVILLIARGYRNWKFYAFWAVVSLFSIILFMSNTFVGATIDQAISIPGDLLQWLTFILALLGTPIVTDNIPLAAFIGGVILLFLVANVIYLGAYRKRWLFVGTWVSLAAFSGAIAFLISLGRLEMVGIERAGSTWYITHSLLIWYAVIAMSFESNRLIKQRLFPRNKMLFRIVTIFSYVILMGFGVNYAVANVWSLQNTSKVFRENIGSNEIGLDETCRLGEPLTRDDCAIYPTLETSKILFKYQLAAFAHPTQLRLLPDDYQSGDIIVFDSQELDLHPFIDRIWLAHALDNLFHIVPENSIPDPQVRNILTVDDIAKLTTISDQPLWYINVNGNTNLTEFSGLINQRYVYEYEIVFERLQIIKYRLK